MKVNRDEGDSVPRSRCNMQPAIRFVCVCDYRSYFEWMIKTAPSVVRQETEETGGVFSIRRQSKVLHLAFI